MTLSAKQVIISVIFFLTPAPNCAQAFIIKSYRIRLCEIDFVVIEKRNVSKVRQSSSLSVQWNIGYFVFRNDKIFTKTYFVAQIFYDKK